MTNEEAVIWLQEHFDPIPDGTEQSMVVGMAIKALESQKQARWIYEPAKIPKCSEIPKCSNCGKYSDDADKVGGAGWCPFCGAKMIGE